MGLVEHESEYYDCNGDPFNDVDGDGIADEEEVSGCTDELACNYNENVSDDDGSCEYAEEYYDCNGDPINDSDGDGIADEEEVGGCTDYDSCNYDPTAADDDGSCYYESIWYYDEDGDGLGDNQSWVQADCDQPTDWVDNYDDPCPGDPLNDSNGNGVCDGSEVYGCTDEDASNYLFNANIDDGSCYYLGCTDSSACNYDPTATENDGSCIFPDEYYDCNGHCINDIDDDGVCDELDNCPDVYNPNQEDFNGDGIGDYCDEIGLEEHQLEWNVYPNPFSTFTTVSFSNDKEGV